MILLGGSTHPDLASQIASRLQMDLCPSKTFKYKNGETNVEIQVNFVFFPKSFDFSFGLKYNFCLKTTFFDKFTRKSKKMLFLVEKTFFI